jgi:hypothetical protein
MYRIPVKRNSRVKQKKRENVFLPPEKRSMMSTGLDFFEDER